MNKEQLEAVWLQNKMIADAIDNQDKVTVYLTSGIKLQGKITEHDGTSIKLNLDDVGQLIFKHAIASILPQHAQGNS